MSIIAALHYVSVASVLFPLLRGWRTRNIVFWYVLLSAVCDILPLIPALKAYRHAYGNIFLLGEFILTGLFFIDELLPRRRRPLAWLGLGLIAATFLAAALFTGFFATDYKGGALLYAVLIPLPLFGFQRIIRSDQPLLILEHPFFLFCAGFFLYVTGSFLLMLNMTRLHNTDLDLALKLWCVHNALNIIKNVSIFLYFRHSSKAPNSIELSD